MESQRFKLSIPATVGSVWDRVEAGTSATYLKDRIDRLSTVSMVVRSSNVFLLQYQSPKLQNVLFSETTLQQRTSILSATVILAVASF